MPWPPWSKQKAAQAPSSTRQTQPKWTCQPAAFGSLQNAPRCIASHPGSNKNEGMSVVWQYSAGTRQQLSTQLFAQIGRYRHDIFIQQLNWGLNAVDGMELDEFDGPDAVYVCAHDEGGQVSGVARLLPTTAPYLMEKAFPQLWGGQQLPRDPKIWELSRFAATSSHPGEAIGHQASALHASELLHRVMRVASMLGAQMLITVSPVGMERLLRLNAFHAMRNGAPAWVGGELLVSLSIHGNPRGPI